MDPDDDFAVCGDCGLPIPSGCDGQCEPPGRDEITVIEVD